MMELEKKYQRIYAKVDLDAIAWNVQQMKERAGAGTKALAVIKTDGYGHGAVPIARYINNLVDYFAVATVQEGVNLREHEITAPILVLGYTAPAYYPTLLDYGIIPTMYTEDMIRAYSAEAQRLGKTGHIHLAVDTGMGRIGFSDTQEQAAVAARCCGFPGIEVDGIFTHFAKADETGKESAHSQYHRFRQFIDWLAKEGCSIPLVHCANSAAIIDLPDFHEDMVRMGISLYGLYPSEEVEKKNIQLKPALSLYSQVIYVKEIQPGDQISYGGTFMAEKPMKVATISAGYGDGYPRNLSNRGTVLIHGKRAYILGRVCMDQFMVDVTQIPQTVEGDLVTLVGQDGKETITVEELAKLAGTFNYEFVCNLGKRIPRIYTAGDRCLGSKDYFHDRYDSCNL